MNFVEFSQLDYAANAARPDPQGLVLDARYRTFHLPFVNASHRDVIPSDAGTTMGRFPTPRRSLVAFIDQRTIDDSHVLGTFMAALKASCVGSKFDWCMPVRRRNLMHFTVSPIEESVLPDRVAHGISGARPFHVRVLGPWLGRARNNGRLYLPACPEKRQDQNVIHEIQQRIGAASTNFYGIGYLNLADHLSAEELDCLLAIISANATALAFQARSIGCRSLRAFDSLVLESKEIASYELRH